MPRGRILCLTSSVPRWAGDSCAPFVLHLAQDLQALDWEVDVLAPHAPGAAPREELDGVRIERFRYLWPASLETVCYGGGALINLRKRPLDHLKLPALVAAQWAAAARRLASGRYDIVHSHWILPQGFVAALAGGIRGTAHVVTAHGGDLFGLRGPWLTSLKRRVLLGADAVTVNSSHAERAVREIAPRAVRVERIPMGIDLAPPGEVNRALAAELRARHRVGAGPLLVFVGRLIEEKGVADLLHAVAQLRNDLPDASAIVVGDGQDRAALEELARSLGLAERVAFPGWVESAAVPAWLAAADAFVGPSRRGPGGWVESQGLAFIEAMAVGVPVVATRLGGIPDSVAHEVTGLLVDERSPAQIAAAVRRLHADPAFAQALAGKARAHVAPYSRPGSAAKFSDLFDSLLSAGRARVDARP